MNPKNAAIFLEQLLAPLSDVGSALITNCYFFRKPGDDGTGVYGVYATTGAAGVRIHHNVFLGFDHQVLFSLIAQGAYSGLDIDGNLFDGAASSHRVQITGFGSLSRVKISNNQFSVWGYPVAINAILIDVGTSGVHSGTVLRGVITNNLFDGEPGVPGCKGIVIAPSDDATCHDILVSGDFFSYLATGIEVTGPNCPRVFVGENAFDDTSVTTRVSLSPQSGPPGAFFPDRLGVGGINKVTSGGASIVKELYAYSTEPFRPRLYLEGDPADSSPGIEFAFDSSNTRRAGIVGTATGSAGAQLEFFTKPEIGSVAQRAVIDPAGNLVWTTGNFTEMAEVGVPAAPGVKRARLFLQDNGSGKTQLCVLFATGAFVVLATQP